AQDRGASPGLTLVRELSEQFIDLGGQFVLGPELRLPLEPLTQPDRAYCQAEASQDTSNDADSHPNPPPDLSPDDAGENHSREGGKYAKATESKLHVGNLPMALEQLLQPCKEAKAPEALGLLGRHSRRRHQGRRGRGGRRCERVGPLRACQNC